MGLRPRQAAAGTIARGAIAGAVAAPDPRVQSALGPVVGGKRAAMGVVRLLAPFQKLIGPVDGLEHDRVIRHELEGLLQLLLDALGGVLGHCSSVPMIQLGERGAPLGMRPGMPRVDRDRLLEAFDRLLQLAVAVAAIRETEVVVIVGPVRVELDGLGELLGGLTPLALIQIRQAKLVVAVRQIGISVDGLRKYLSRFRVALGPAQRGPPIRVGLGRPLELRRPLEHGHRVRHAGRAAAGRNPRA